MTPDPTGRPRRPSRILRAAPARRAATQQETARQETEKLLSRPAAGSAQDASATAPGPPFNRRNPFLLGVLAALGLFAGYGIVLALVQLSSLITWLVIALFIALGLEPIVVRLVGLGIARGWSVLICILGLLAVCALLSWVIVPPIVDQVNQLVNDAPGYLDQLQHNHWAQAINRRWHLTDRVPHELQKSLNQDTVMSVFGGVLGFGKAFADSLVAVVSVIVLTVYFVGTMPQIKSAAYQLAPHNRRPRVVYLGEEISRRVGGYLLGQLCVAAVNAAFVYVIMLVLGLPYAAVLATVIGLLALVPIVGTILGAIIITLVALASSSIEALIVLGYYVAYHAFETYVLSPRIMQRVVKVPPVVTIVAVLAGGALLGILGALIAIPVAAGLLLIYQEVVVPRQQRS